MAPPIANTLPLPAAPAASYSDVPGAASVARNAIVEHDCITAKELASWLRVNRKTVYEYAARNVIPCRRLGRRLVFLRPAVVAWLARSPTGNAAPDHR